MIIGLIILFMTPDLVKAVKQLFVPKPGPLDQAGIGVLFGGVKTGFESGMGELQKWGGIAYYMKPVGSLLSRIPGVGKMFEQYGPTQRP